MAKLYAYAQSSPSFFKYRNALNVQRLKQANLRRQRNTQTLYSIDPRGNTPLTNVRRRRKRRTGRQVGFGALSSMASTAGRAIGSFGKKVLRDVGTSVARTGLEAGLNKLEGRRSGRLLPSASSVKQTLASSIRGNLPAGASVRPKRRKKRVRRKKYV